MAIEEYRGCENCFYDYYEETQYPCSDCRNSLLHTDPNYNDAPFLWRSPGHCVETQNSSVDHPHHYNQGGIECIDAMIAAFGEKAVEHFCLINAFKYVWRSREKNGFEDIDKAIWYLNKAKELNSGE